MSCASFSAPARRQNPAPKLARPLPVEQRSGRAVFAAAEGVEHQQGRRRGRPAAPCFWYSTGVSSQTARDALRAACGSVAFHSPGFQRDGLSKRLPGVRWSVDLDEVVGLPGLVIELDSAAV